MVTRDKKGWRGIWRPSKSPSVPVALGARSVGNADVERGWSHGSGTIRWINFYWAMEGQVGLLADGRKCVLRKNEITFHPAGTKIDGYPIEKGGQYRWLTLDGPLAREIVSSFGFRMFVCVDAGPVPVDLFVELEKEIAQVSPHSEYRASAIVYEILTRACWGMNHHSYNPRRSTRAQTCRRIIEEEFGDPDLTIKQLAWRMGVHRSRLSRLFSSEYGVSPSSFLQRLRMKQALKLLKSTDMDIRDIAGASGFGDPAYFTRWCCKEMGTNPRRLRDIL